MPILTRTLKQKIDNVEYNANKYIAPSASNTEVGLVKVNTDNITLNNGKISYTKDNFKKDFITNPSITYVGNSNIIVKDLLYLSKNQVYNNPKKVVLKGSFSTTTTSLTCTDCIIGAPMYVLHTSRSSIGAHGSIHIISGATIGSEDWYKIGTASYNGTVMWISNCFITIPTATTVVLSFSALGDDETVLIYQ